MGQVQQALRGAVQVGGVARQRVEAEEPEAGLARVVEALLRLALPPALHLAPLDGAPLNGAP